jgi:hypothetical protein
LQLRFAFSARYVEKIGFGETPLMNDPDHFHQLRRTWRKEQRNPVIVRSHVAKELKRKRTSPSLPTKEEERAGERSLVLLDFPSPQPSPRSFLAGRGSA